MRDRGQLELDKYHFDVVDFSSWFHIMDPSPRRDRLKNEFGSGYHRKVSRGQTPSPPKFNRCELVMGDRLFAAITMALPFVVCFTTFGVFNLIAGSILTSMAWKPRTITRASTSPFPEEEAAHIREKLVDPLKIMGPILLITGVMLVVVGFVLGLTACRSVYGTRDFSKFNVQTNYSGAIQLSGINCPNNYATLPYIGIASHRKNSAPLVSAKKTALPLTTKVTIETPSFPVSSLSGKGRESDVVFDSKPEVHQAETLYERRDSQGNDAAKVRIESVECKNSGGENSLANLSSPGCSYFNEASCSGVNITRSTDEVWSSETSFLVPPYQLDPQTYIT